MVFGCYNILSMQWRNWPEQQLKGEQLPIRGEDNIVPWTSPSQLLSLTILVHQARGKGWMTLQQLFTPVLSTEYTNRISCTRNWCNTKPSYCKPSGVLNVRRQLNSGDNLMPICYQLFSHHLFRSYLLSFYCVIYHYICFQCSLSLLLLVLLFS